jgi:hypothetical protein
MTTWNTENRWENIIKLDFRTTCCENWSWMGLAQDYVQWITLVEASLNLLDSTSTDFII